MKFYNIPKNVIAQYTYKGIRLSWYDLPSCNYYTIGLNLENDPVNGEYKAISGVIDTPNEYTIQNNLIRERTIIPYVKIYGYINNPTYTLSKTDSASGEIYAYTDWVQNGATTYGVNNQSYLSIPTYDGSGQAIHPDVLYFADGWNGYHYWMAMTPYDTATHENPSIVVSNDGVNWEVPPGLTNPLEPGPSGLVLWGNSDTELYYESGTLYLMWRKYENALGSGIETIYSKSSTDGINWTTKKELFQVSSSNHAAALSPAYIKYNDEYRIYVVDTQGGNSSVLRYYYNPAGYMAPDDPFQDSKICTLHGVPAGKRLWHLNITKVDDDLLIGVFTICPEGDSGGNSILYYAQSSDGDNWYIQHKPLLTIGESGSWDDNMIYRSSLVYDGEWKLYYSGEDNNGDWHTGLTTLTPGLITNANKIHIYNDSDNYNLSIDSISDGGPWSILHSTDTVPNWTDGSMYIADPINNDAIYGPFTVRVYPRKTAIEIARRLDVMFKARYKDASLAKVWHRRRHGEKCTCYDSVESSIADQNCTICYGVGYKGGYVGPEDIYITYIADPITGRYDSRGGSTQDTDRIVQGIANMDAYIVPNDIIEDNLGVRYRVLGVRYSSIDKTVLVSQSVTLEKLPRNDIIYSLEG